MRPVRWCVAVTGRHARQAGHIRECPFPDMRANNGQQGGVRALVAPDSRCVSRAMSANNRRTAEYTPRRDVSVADAVPIRRRSAASDACHWQGGWGLGGDVRPLRLVLGLAAG